MNRIARASLAALALLAASPSHAVTNQDGQVLITQAAVNAGNITPGDTPGFPVTISVGGSYRLASNLVVTSLVNGIEVRANEVSIDMGGFTLAGSGAGRNGITSFNRTLRISNGNVRGFLNDGIRSVATFLTVDRMIVTGNGRHGVNADDTGATPEAVSFASVTDSRITNNISSGVTCTNHCLVENSILSLNQASGIFFEGKGGMALGNVVTSNGFYGIFFGQQGGAGNNTVLDNGSVEISGSYIAMQPNACSPACPPL